MPMIGYTARPACQRRPYLFRTAEHFLPARPFCDTEHPMIKDFSDKRTSAVFLGETPKGFPNDIANVARRKLRMLDQAKKISDLRVPPSNHLEALVGDRAGQHSIRVNDQWRLCFRWDGSDAYDVEITDYH
jgi:proteic killer suppression protein